MEVRARYALIGMFMLAVLGAGFGFVYWLQAYGGLTEKTVYRVRFAGSVAGLLVGGPVLFNGIRVGEVTALQLSGDDPEQVTATIAVSPGTPVRADTKIGLEPQGLLGSSAAISLAGGTPTLPILVGRSSDPPLLVADAAATRGMTEAARAALQRLDTLLAENSQSLHGTIENLNTFTAALARNSDRIDGIVAGLEHMVGVPAKPPTGYDLVAPVSFPGLQKTPHGQLVVAEPTVLVVFDTQRILVQSDSGERSSMENAQWSDSIPKLVQAKIIHSFENASYVQVNRPLDGLTVDFQLLIDIRSFQVLMTPDPVADVEFSAKILTDGRITKVRIFHATVPMRATEAALAAAALNEAFGQAVTDLVVWTSEQI